MKKFAFLTLLILALPCQTWAHEGHGTPGQGDTVTHYALEPIHLPLALVICALVVWSIYRFLKWSAVQYAMQYTSRK